MFIGVGGAVVLNIVGICKDLLILCMRPTYHVGPMDTVLWCIHNFLMSRLLFGVRFVVPVVLWVHHM